MTSRSHDADYLTANRFYNRLSGEYSPQTVRATHATLHRALEDAIDEGHIPQNPTARAKLPRAEHKEAEAWNADELKQFLAHAEDHRFFSSIVLAVSTGLRRSEVLGLRWCNVDLENARAAIVDTLVPIDSKPVLRIGETKSRRSRSVIALDPHTVAVLGAHRKTQAEERMAGGPAWADMDLLFTNSIGESLNPATFTRTWKRLATEAGVKPLTPHSGARHTWASLALSGSVPMKIVTERLGHSSIQITADRYSHVSEQMDREAAERVAQMFQ